MFPPAPIAQLFSGRSQAQALEEWREAESLVATRWRAFLDVGPEGRPSAFASYVAALDIEEAAALAMAALSSRIAA
jgi:hypothetical protein